MMEYRVLAGASAKSLEEQVIDLSREGFIPQGGIMITTIATHLTESYMKGNGMITQNELLFSQAMVKVTLEKK